MSIIAVDFDGTLCTHAFPEIGEIRPEHQKTIDYIRNAKALGHMIVLWTCRDDKEERPYLTEAVEWCKVNNIPIDYANEYPNPGWSGHPLNAPIPCRKVCADLYIDDKCMNFLHLP